MQRYPTLYNKDLGDEEDLSSIDKMDSSNGSESVSRLQETKLPKQMF